MHHRTFFKITYGGLKQKRNYDYSHIGIQHDTEMVVKECNHCKFVFVNPRIKPEHQDLIYNICKKRKYNNTTPLSLSKKTLDTKLRYMTGLVEALYKADVNNANPVLFDFGSGEGYSMRFSKLLGFNVYGVDICLPLIEKCQAEGLQVTHLKEFDKIYPNIKADVIMWQSNIEHVIDLNSSMRFIADKSKKGTVLFVNGLTPRKINIEKRRGCFIKAHFVEHVNYFPLRTLDLFMSKYNFFPMKAVRVPIILSITDTIKYLCSYSLEYVFNIHVDDLYNGSFRKTYVFKDKTIPAK